MNVHTVTPQPVIWLHPSDSVVIARATMLPGTPVADGIAVSDRIPAGHKVAVRPIAVGEAVRRYNQIIGFATDAIAPGQHVHVHNLGMGSRRIMPMARMLSPPSTSISQPPSRASAARTGG